MKTYKINYSGNSTFLKRRCGEVAAYSEREAVKEFYASYCEQNYFPQDDGSIYDCQGNCIAGPNDDCICYDGGYITAEGIDE